MKKIITTLLLIISCSIHVTGQNLLLPDDITNKYIDYLINSGKMIPQFVLQQPYNMSEIFKRSDIDSVSSYLYKYWQKIYGRKNTSLGIDLHGGCGYTDSWDPLYRINFNFTYHSDHISLVNRTDGDVRYKTDPYFAGDLSESDHWLYGRVNDAFMNISYDHFELFIGKTARNWGPVNQYSMILSDNPYTYDHVLFTYKGKRIKISNLFTRLEDMSAAEYKYKIDSTVYYSNVRKFLSGHRLDIHISYKLQLGLTEMAIYGGEDRDFELLFLNPMTFYYPVQRNDGKQMSGLWCLDIFYKPKPKVTLYWQLLIDDIIVNNDPGVDDRAAHPDRLGTMFSLRTGDWPVDGINSGITYTRVWNRTYQSLRSYENYHYRKLGLGYPDASCEEIKFNLTYWMSFPFVVSEEVIWGRYGDVELTDVFYMDHEPFPVPSVIHNVVSRTNIMWLPSPKYRFNCSLSYFKNADHYLNWYSGSNIVIELTASWFLNTSFNL